MAVYKQRDLVWLKFDPPLPDGKELQHPVIIISCRTANDNENFYTGLLMSSTIHKDRFSFPVIDDMFESPLNKKDCQVRLYITVSFRESQIKNFANRMKTIFFKSMLQQFKDYVLVVD